MVGTDPDQAEGGQRPGKGREETQTRQGRRAETRHQEEGRDPGQAEGGGQRPGTGRAQTQHQAGRHLQPPDEGVAAKCEKVIALNDTDTGHSKSEFPQTKGAHSNQGSQNLPRPWG